MARETRGDAQLGELCVSRPRQDASPVDVHKILPALIDADARWLAPSRTQDLPPPNFLTHLLVRSWKRAGAGDGQDAAWPDWHTSAVAVTPKGCPMSFGRSKGKKYHPGHRKPQNTIRHGSILSHIWAWGSISIGGGELLEVAWGLKKANRERGIQQKMPC